MNTLYCNGRPVAPDVLATALVNYGHFTSLQVRDGAAQGLELHLQRLLRGTVELFDAGLDVRQVRDWMAAALDAEGVADASLRVTVFSRRFDARKPLAPAEVDVLVAVSSLARFPDAPLRVCVRPHQRAFAHLKHVGTFELFQHRRQAMREGHDDVVFSDATGRLTEGSTWNLALWDGRQVVWTKGEVLDGITRQLLRKTGLAQVDAEVTAADLSGFTGAVAVNANGIRAIGNIDSHRFSNSDWLARQVRQALAGVEWQPLQDPAG